MLCSFHYVRVDIHAHLDGGVFEELVDKGDFVHIEGEHDSTESTSLNHPTPRGVPDSSSLTLKLYELRSSCQITPEELIDLIPDAVVLQLPEEEVHRDTIEDKAEVSGDNAGVLLLLAESAGIIVDLGNGTGGGVMLPASMLFVDKDVITLNEFHELNFNDFFD